MEEEEEEKYTNIKTKLMNMKSIGLLHTGPIGTKSLQIVEIIFRFRFNWDYLYKMAEIVQNTNLKFNLIFIR